MRILNEFEMWTAFRVLINWCFEIIKDRKAKKQDFNPYYCIHDNITIITLIQ